MTAAEHKLVRELVWHIQAMSEGKNDACEEEICRMATKALAILDAEDSAECQTCYGEGEVAHPKEDTGPHFRGMQCPACNGTGRAEGGSK